MSLILTILQVFAALLYTMSGVMKTFTFDTASEGVKSFDALPKVAWQVMGVLEIVCVAGLVVPVFIKHLSDLTVIAAAMLAVESIVFIYVHVKYSEKSALVFSAALGLVMLFITLGRLAVN